MTLCCQTYIWQIVLLDFGGCRQFSTSFVDDYIRVIHGAIVGNDKEVLEASQRLGFLTGEEDAVMQKVRKESVDAKNLESNQQGSMV